MIQGVTARDSGRNTRVDFTHHLKPQTNTKAPPMKAAIIHEFGPPEVFKYEDVADPAPKPDHAVIKVLACGINRYDLFLRMGGVQAETSLPHVMGADVVGEIIQIDGADSNHKVGDRVIIAPGFPIDPADWNHKPENFAPSYTVTGTTLWGGYAQCMSVPTRFLLADKTNLSADECATLPLVLVTAMHSVKTLGEVKPGQHVLIQAGASGSGSMCIQVAKTLGAKVATTVGDDSKFEVATQCGADLVINHRKENFREKVLEWTDGKGVDMVIDNVGGGILKDNLTSMRRGGILVNFGLVGGIKDEINFAMMIFNQYQFRGSMMGSMDELREGLELVQAGKIKPVLDRTFPLSDAAQAHQYIEERKVKGNVVLQPWP
ncbi:MAG TPA: zinc-binding dehydrogenase [Phycisphaerae bacterium]|nr:zinc-binding dehydrogenase [Phycisphaerae bacterium]